MMRPSAEKERVMRGRIFLGMGLFCAALLPAAADDLSGNWVVSAIGRPACSFTQSGNFFRGACEGSAAKGIAFGVNDPDRIVWTYYWTTKADGRTGADVFSGRLGADGSITGLDSNTSGQIAPFIARRQSN
jgi:hypothetical protein